MAFGVYVHVPFCAKRCDYCAFATWTDRDPLMDSYTRAVVAEIEQARTAGDLPAPDTVFIGGGTPSRLPATGIAAILAAIDAPGAEVTIECNPEDADEERFATWRAAGATRVSFGVQSMVQPVLDSLGRRHGAASVASAAVLARSAGFDSWNADLIFGAAAESDEDWMDTLTAVLALGPPHVSAYALTVEPGTPLATDPSRHPDDDVQARRYAMADAALSAAGLEWYEVSNWARPGHACRHNRLYWSQGGYRGFGCAAHSHRDGRRWWNVRTPERYIAAITAGRSPEAASESLTPHERAFEALILGVRTAAGVPSEALPDDPALAGLVEHSFGRAVLTVEGRLLANEVSTRLLVPQ